MSTVLLLEDENPRALEVKKNLDLELPALRIQLARSTVEFRYAFVSQSPEIVVIRNTNSQEQATKLVWEVTALQPSTKIIVVASDECKRKTWAAFGDTLFDVVGEEVLVDTIVAATSSIQAGETAARAAALHDVQHLPIDRHRMRNRLAGLLAGLHAMAAELRATAWETERIPDIADEYVDRLVEVVGDLCAMVAAAETRTCDEHHG